MLLFLILRSISPGRQLIHSRSNVMIKSNPDVNRMGSLPSYWLTVISTDVFFFSTPALSLSFTLSLSNSSSFSSLTVEKCTRKIHSPHTTSQRIFTPENTNTGMLPCGFFIDLNVFLCSFFYCLHTLVAASSL